MLVSLQVHRLFLCLLCSAVEPTHRVFVLVIVFFYIENFLLVLVYGFYFFDDIFYFFAETSFFIYFQCVSDCSLEHFDYDCIKVFIR